jgi:hypothetical protein
MVFETFVLRDHVADYRLHHPDWPFLFNSYYEAEGVRLSRAARGMLSRPSLAEVFAYRAAVDEALLAALPTLSPAALDLVRLGCHHEQQHQELLLTDILHAFSTHPLEPALWSQDAPPPAPPDRKAGSPGAAVWSKSAISPPRKLRLRLRGAQPHRLPRTPCAGRPHRHQWRMDRLYRERRL